MQGFIVTLQKQCWEASKELGRHSMFQQDIDLNHTSKFYHEMVKILYQPTMSSDLNPIENLWGILKTRNATQLKSIIQDEWKSTSFVMGKDLVDSIAQKT